MRQQVQHCRVHGNNKIARYAAVILSEVPDKQEVCSRLLRRRQVYKRVVERRKKGCMEQGSNGRSDGRSNLDTPLTPHIERFH
jgi:hypothetical protein